jgi:hypothetical protein
LKIVKASAVSAADLPEGFKKAGMSETKAAASPRAPADQPTGAKAPTSTKGRAVRQQSSQGQESPGTQVPPPMQTRKRASGAGGLRGVAGSGSNGDTCVATGNPSSKPGS